jgi:hypothetical protein
MSLWQWIRESGPRLLTSLGETLRGMLALVAAQAPPLIEHLGTWAAAFVEWAIPAGTNLLRTLGRVLADVLGWIGESAPPLIEQLAEWAANFSQWALDALPGLYANLLELLTGLLNWIERNGPPIAAQLGEWALVFAEWVINEATPNLTSSLFTLLEMLTTWIRDNAVPLAETILNEWVPAMTGWVADEAVPRLELALGNLWAMFTRWFEERTSGMFDEGARLGENIINGMRQGIIDMWGDFTAWAAERMVELARILNPAQLLVGGDEAPDRKPQVKAMARGGTFRRGDLAVVGETQAELVQFGSFGRVFPDLSPLAAAASATMPAMPPGGRSVTLNAPMSIGNVTVDSEARMSELQQMIAQRDEALIAQMLDALESIGLEGVA